MSAAADRIYESLEVALETADEKALARVRDAIVDYRRLYPRSYHAFPPIAAGLIDAIEQAAGYVLQEEPPEPAPLTLWQAEEIDQRALNPAAFEDDEGFERGVLSATRGEIYGGDKS